MSALKDLVSANGRRAMFAARRMVRIRRSMPHFILIGAQKSGTSSMFAYLKQHPQIVRPIFKEPYFFDRNYRRGLDWYGCNFPARGTIERLNDSRGAAHLTFEATATYVFDPHVPARIARDIETKKFILLLRNPVDRAISAYWHACRMGRETRSLGEALKMDLDRYHEELKRGKPTSPPLQPTYLQRGIYHLSVQRWRSVFSQDDLLVMQSEAMFADPQDTMSRVFAFLGIARRNDMDYAPQNVGGYDETDPETRAFLTEFYRPHNETLSQLCGTPFTW